MLPNRRKKPSQACGKMQGFMLVEVLVSILIFALGLVAIVALQARTMATTGDVQYRAEAMHLANAYIGEIWAELPTFAGAAAYRTGGARYDDFSDKVVQGLPGATAPTVTLVQGTAAADGTPEGGIPDTSFLVTVDIQWTGPDGVTHTYSQTSTIGRNPVVGGGP